MIVTDPIADMLTRMRNAIINKDNIVKVPASKIKLAIADLLLQEGYIKAVNVEGGDIKKDIFIELKYGPRGERVIQGLKRISKPGLRVYANKEELPKVLNGLGIAILSTNKGLLTDKQARKLNVGGEVLAYVW